MDEGAAAAAPIRVLFICTGNSARSQMAEALLRRLGGGEFEAFSAGIEPNGVNPLTIAVLDEIGIDIRAATSKSVAGFLGQDFDYAVTVCDRAREACPVFPGLGPRRPGRGDRQRGRAAHHVPTDPRRDRHAPGRLRARAFAPAGR
jgi:Protein-tyrosine-phosphatase